LVNDLFRWSIHGRLPLCKGFFEASGTVVLAAAIHAAFGGGLSRWP
jgi:hypothetical protein